MRDNFMTRMFQTRDAETPAACEAVTQSASYADKTVMVALPQNALAIGAYYRALSLRAQTFGQLIPEYQKCDKNGGGNYVTDNYGSAKDLNWLLQVRPNPLMTSVKLMENLELQRIQQGNGVAYIERDSIGDIKGIWLCSSAALDLTTNKYIVSYNCVGGEKTISGVPATNVLHLRNIFSYDGGLTGIPTLVYMRDILTLDATNMRLQTENAAKGGRVKLLLTQGEQKSLGAVGKYKKSQMTSAKQQLQDSIGDDVVVVPWETNVTPMSMTATEMDILSSRTFTIGEVSRFLGVPKILLGDASNSSYKTPEAALQEFYKFTVQPEIREFEDEANYKILSNLDWNSHRIHLCERDLMRLDPMAQAQLNEKLLGIGVKTINEIRREYDQPSISGGDDAFVTVQAQKVADIGKVRNGEGAGKGEEK